MHLRRFLSRLREAFLMDLSRRPQRPARGALFAPGRRRPALEILEDRMLLSVDPVGLPDWVDLGSRPMISAGSTADPDNPASGAVEEVVVDPNNPARLFVATVNGGIWRSTDGNRPFNGLDDDGANGVDDPAEQPSWTPLTDTSLSLAIGDIAFSPLDATGNTIFAGTGSASSLSNAGGTSIGVLRSTDGGASWSAFPVNPLGAEPRIRAILPTTFDGNLAVPGVQQVVLVGTSTATGLFRSTDGGQNYTAISNNGTSGLPAGAVTQIIADPNNAAQFFAGVVGQGVFRSTDGGANWVAANGTGGNTLANLGTSTSIQVAADPGGGTTVLYALISGPSFGVFTSNDGGTNWTALAALPGGFLSGFNNLYTTRAADQLVIDPTNNQIVYVSEGYGGLILRYDPAGTGNWVQIQGPGFAAGGTTPHADNRDLKFLANNVLAVTCDGGIYFIRNPQNAAANRWTSLHGRGANGLGVTEYTNVAWDSRFDVATGGAQDNGTTVENGAGDVVWTLYSGNDGGDVQVDTVNAGAGRVFRYASSQNFGWLRRYTFDSATNQPVGAVDLFPAGGLASFTAPFIPQYELDAVAPARLVTGASGANPVYELLNAATAPNAAGATWQAVAVGAGFGAVNGGAMAYGGRLNGLDNPEVLVVGSGNRVFVRSTAGGTLTATTANFPGGTIQDVVLDPDNWQHFFVADGTNVYETTDAGATAGNWRNLTPAGRPTGNTSLQTIAFIPSARGGTVVVGGNQGVSRLPVGVAGAPWTRFGLGLPNALVQDLDYDATDNVLLAGTFGRGAWKIPNVRNVIETPGVLLVCGDEQFPNQDDTFRLVRNALNPQLLEIYINNVLEFSGPLAAIQQIDVFGAGGNDTLIVDSSNGLINVFNGIRYDGDHGCPGQVGAGIGGFDTLRLTQAAGSQTSDTLAIGATNGSGRSTILGSGGTQTVDFEYLEPVIDVVASPSFTITSDAALASLLQGANLITYLDSPLLAGGGRITVDAFEPIDFLNKTTLTINAGDGADSINLIASSTPAALAGITINCGSGADAVTAAATAATPGLVVNGGLGNDYLAADGNLNGDQGNDILIGGAGNNTLNGGDGEDILDGRGGSNLLNGGADTDTLLVSGTSGPDALTTTHGAGTFTITGGLSAGTNTITSMQLVRVEAGDGADAITLNLLAAGGLNYIVLGGNPIGTLGGDSLTVNSAAAMTVTPGPENDAGSVDAATTTLTNVSFDEIELLILGGGGGGVINGTNGPDTITVIARDSSTHAGADGVQDFTVSVNAGPELLFLNSPSVTVNALAGSDQVTLVAPAPNNAVWDVEVTVNGGVPAADTDRLVVQTPGAAAETVVYTPTAADGGTLDLTTLSAPVTITGVEQLSYDGQGDNDSLKIVGSAGPDFILHSPGVNDQAGSFRVNTLLALSYQGLGAGGAPAVDGAGGNDTLVYDGTAGNDAFVVGMAGQVSLNSRLPVGITSVEVLTLEGFAGDDSFALVPTIAANPYTTLNLHGGGQASAAGDQATLTASAAALITVSGQTLTQGGKTVAGSGLESIDLNGAGNHLTYNGVADVTEAITIAASPTANRGQVSVPNVVLLTFTNVPHLDVNGNPADNDTLVFAGTNNNDTFQVNLAALGTVADPVLKLQTASSALLLTLTNYTGFTALGMNGLDGADTFNVFVAPVGAGRRIFVDGGLDTGKKKQTDVLNVLYARPRPRIVQSAATQNPTSGLVSLDYGSAFFLIEYAGIENVTIHQQ
jgi:hypothetical protein